MKLTEQLRLAWVILKLKVVRFVLVRLLKIHIWLELRNKNNKEL